MREWRRGREGGGTWEREVWGGWGLNISGFQDPKSRKGKLGKAKVLGKQKCGVGGECSGPQMKVGERGAKVKRVGNGKLKLGGY